MRRRPASWLGLWARDSSIVLVSQITALVATTALAVVVARELGPAEFGVLAGLQGAALVLTIFVDAGIATYVLRELTGSREMGLVDGSTRAVGLVSAGLSAAVLAASILVVSSIAIGAVLLQDATLAFALGGLVGYTSLLACADSLEVVYRARRRLGLLSAAILLEKGALVTLVSIALLAHGGILGIASGYLVAGALRLAYDLVVVSRLGLLDWQRRSRGAIGAVLRGALPFGLGSTIPTAVVRLDATLISLLSTTAAGLYAVGDRVLTVLLIVPSTSAATLFPLLARERSARDTAHRAAGVMFLAGAVIAATGIEAAPFVVPRLFGTAYEGAVVARAADAPGNSVRLCVEHADDGPLLTRSRAPRPDSDARLYHRRDSLSGRGAIGIRCRRCSRGLRAALPRLLRGSGSHESQGRSAESRGSGRRPSLTTPRQRPLPGSRGAVSEGHPVYPSTSCPTRRASPRSARDAKVTDVRTGRSADA